MSLDRPLTRKQAIVSVVGGLAAVALPAAATGQAPTSPKPQTPTPTTPPVSPPSPGPTPGQTPPPVVPPTNEITVDDLRAVEKLDDLNFADEERKKVLESVQGFRAGYDAIRKEPIRETTGVPLAFRPAPAIASGGGAVRATATRTKGLTRPSRDEDLAFLTVHELGQLLRAKQITSVELTRLYIGRLKQYGDALLAVITLTEDLALQQAADADSDLAKKIDRGPLHGIPYGAKDLLATKGIGTTWGADPYKGQVFDYDAAVIDRLRAAGAVLVAKLSMGALAMDDVWFKGKTKNPWNPSQGSSGSSAGSAAATAAGLVGFSIGTETSGSILSPSARCRVTGLRPTFGRVSRFGAMELAYSLDRIGPICRDAEDCGLVLSALCGADPRDPASVDRPYEYPERLDASALRIAWVGGEAAMDGDPAVKRLRALGATVVHMKPAPFPEAIMRILDVECASAFDAFTRTDLIHQLQNSEWPDAFRAARYVPAVEYIQAQRARELMMQQFERDFADFDALLAPGIGGEAFNQANFSGYPAIAMPFGDDGNGGSVARTLIGRPYREGHLATLAKAVEDGFDYTRRRPDLSAVLHN